MGDVSEGPVRVQLSRRKGWRMPENTVKVSRPGPWGNPFNLRASEHCWTAIAFGHKADPAGRHAASVTMFKLWIAGGKATTVDGCGLYGSKGKKTVAFAESPAIIAADPPSLEQIRRGLAGKNLACWCRPDQPCHADVLLEIANSSPKDTKHV
jgi:hypothetical protein